MRRKATSKYNQRRVKPKRRWDKPPKAVETGDPVTGYRGAKIYKGTNVSRVGEDRPGRVTGVGREQCTVQWYEGPEQAEITIYLERF